MKCIYTEPTWRCLTSPVIPSDRRERGGSPTIEGDAHTAEAGLGMTELDISKLARYRYKNFFFSGFSLFFLCYCSPNSAPSTQIKGQAQKVTMAPEEVSMSTVAALDIGIITNTSVPTISSPHVPPTEEAVKEEILPPLPLIISGVVVHPVAPVDTTPPPILQSLVPETGLANPMPTQISVVFSKAIRKPGVDSISITGTCVSLPLVTSINPLGDATAWSVFLSSGDCQEGQSFTVSMDPTHSTDVSGTQAGTGPSTSRTYTLQTKGPTVVWGALPDSTYLSATRTLLIPFTYAKATRLAEGISVAGENVQVTGTPVCKVSMQALSVTGGTLSLSGCTGDGPLSVQVKAGVTQDELGNLSSPSSLLNFTVDNTAPTVLTYIPESISRSNPLPTTVTAVFSESIQNSLSPTLFSVSGCGSAKAGAALSEKDTIATVQLATENCGDGDTVTVTVDPTQLIDLAGNPGTDPKSKRSYTLHTQGPSVILSMPTTLLVDATSTPLLNATSTIAIPVTYTSSGTISAGPNTAAPYLLSQADGVSCTLSLDALTSTGTTATSTLSISSCIGNGFFSVALVGGMVKDELGNLSTQSATLNFHVDNTSPTVDSFTPATSRSNSLPRTLTAVFSKPVRSPLSGKLFSVSGCNAAATNVTLTGGTIATAQLLSTSCTDGNIVTVQIDPTQLTDLAGNSGSGPTLTRAYTLLTKGPQVTLSPTPTAPLNAASSIQIQVAYAGSGILSSAENPPNPTYTLTSTGTAGCTFSLSPIVLSGNTGSSSLSVSNCTGAGTISVAVNEGILQDDVGNLSTPSNPLLFTVDTVPPKITSSGISLPSSRSTPLTVSYTCSKAINPISSSAFTFSSTCVGTPTLTISMSSDAKTATASLSGADCSNGTTTTTLTLDSTKISDLAGNAGTSNPPTSYTVTLAPPTVGSGITIGSVPNLSGGFVYGWRLSWGIASDTTASAPSLQYQVVGYPSATLNAATNVSSATVVLPWISTSAAGSPLTVSGSTITYDATSLPPLISSAAPTTTIPYYFAVLVRNPATGLIGYYPTSTAAPLNKYLFFVPAVITLNYSGILGGWGADARCQSQKPSSVPTAATIKAFLVDGVNRTAAPTPKDWVLTSTTSYFYADTKLRLGITDGSALFQTPITPSTSAYTFATGLTPSWGSSLSNCNMWTTWSTGSATYGSSSSTTSVFFSSGGSLNSCNSTPFSSLLCVQQ